MLGKQTRHGFNLGVCLEVLLMEHVKVIFRGTYVLSKSMSLTLGGSNFRVTLNVEPERSSEPVTVARTLGHWLSFRQEVWRPVLKDSFSEEEVGEGAAVAAPTPMRLWELLPCVQ